MARFAEVLRSMGAPVDELGGYPAASGLTMELFDMVPRRRLAEACDRIFEARDDETAIYADVLGSSLAAAVIAHRSAPSPEAAEALDAISDVLLAVARALENMRGADDEEEEAFAKFGEVARAPEDVEAARKFLRDVSKKSTLYIGSPFRRPATVRALLLREADALIARQSARTFGALARAIVAYGFPSLRGLSVRELVRRFTDGAKGFNLTGASTDAKSVAAHALDLAGVAPATVSNLLDAAEAMSALRKERREAGAPATGSARRTRRRKATSRVTSGDVNNRVDQGAGVVHVRDMTEPQPVLTRHQLREVGVRAGCDPRSVSAYLEGRPQHSTTRARIGDALCALGFAVPAPARPEAPSAPVRQSGRAGQPITEPAPSGPRRRAGS